MVQQHAQEIHLHQTEHLLPFKIITGQEIQQMYRVTFQVHICPSSQLVALEEEEEEVRHPGHAVAQHWEERLVVVEQMVFV